MGSSKNKRGYEVGRWGGVWEELYRNWGEYNQNTLFEILKRRKHAFNFYKFMYSFQFYSVIGFCFYFIEVEKDTSYDFSILNFIMFFVFQHVYGG